MDVFNDPFLPPSSSSPSNRPPSSREHTDALRRACQRNRGKTSPADEARGSGNMRLALPFLPQFCLICVPEPRSLGLCCGLTRGGQLPAGEKQGAQSSQARARQGGRGAQHSRQRTRSSEVSKETRKNSRCSGGERRGRNTSATSEAEERLTQRDCPCSFKAKEGGNGRTGSSESGHCVRLRHAQQSGRTALRGSTEG